MTNVNPALCRVYGQAVQYLRALPLFQALDGTQLPQLLDGAQARSWAVGETVFWEGDPASHFFLVIEGTVQVVRYAANGDERLFGQFQPGQLVAIVAMFMPHGRYPMQARSSGAEPAVLLCLARERLQQLCRQQPALALAMLENFSLQIYRRINEVEWVTNSSAAQRLAAYFHALHARQPGPIHLPMSQRQLATSLGVRAETLSRLLTEWQQRGYVRGKQRDWELLDEAALRQLGEQARRAF